MGIGRVIVWGNMQRKTVLSWLRVLSFIGVYGGLLMPLVFIPIVIFPFVFSKLIAFQILVGLTFPAYLVLAYMEPGYRLPKHLLLGAISAYFVALLCSVLFAVDPSRAWWGNQERMNGLFTLLHFFAWLTMAVGVLRVEKQWIRLFHYEVVLSAVMGVVAILQRPFPTLLLFKASERVGGLLDNPIYMAAYQIFNLFFILYLWTKTPSKGGRIWLLIAAAIDLTAFFLAQSRGALFGLLAGLVIFFAIRGLCLRDKRVRRGTIAGIILLLGGYGLLFSMRNSTWIASTPFQRLVSINLNGGGTETRFIAWKIAFDGFRERPLFGWGLDDFHILFNQKYNPESMRFSVAETWFDRAHNTVLDVVSMTGVAGTITFFGIFIAIFVVLLRAYRAKQIDAHLFAIFIGLPVAYFVQNLFVFDHPAGFSMSFLMYAFLIAVTRTGFTEDAAPTTTTGKTRAFSWGVTGIVAVVALLIVWRGSVLPFRASRTAIQENGYFAANMIPEAHAAAQAASELETMYLDEQTFLLVRNLVPIVSNGTIKKYPKYQELIGLTKRLLDEEIARHPRNAYTIYLAARFYQETARLDASDLTKAEAFYRQAIDLSPKRQQFWYSLSDFYQQTGRTAQATEIQKQLLTFDPLQGQPHWIYGVNLAYQLNQKKEGAEEMRQGMTARYPYSPVDIREVLQLVDAYQTLSDAEGLKTIPKYFRGIQPVSTQIAIYLEIAKRLESSGLPEVRDQVLDYAAANVNPEAKTLYTTGGATSAPQAKASAQPVVTPTPVTTTAAGKSGTGPRR